MFERFRQSELGGGEKTADLADQFRRPVGSPTLARFLADRMVWWRRELDDGFVGWGREIDAFIAEPCVLQPVVGVEEKNRRADNDLVVTLEGFLGNECAVDENTVSTLSIADLERKASLRDLAMAARNVRIRDLNGIVRRAADRGQLAEGVLKADAGTFDHEQIGHDFLGAISPEGSCSCCRDKRSDVGHKGNRDFITGQAAPTDTLLSTIRNLSNHGKQEAGVPVPILLVRNAFFVLN